MGNCARWACRRTSQTAHSPRQHSGSLVVTYPFHPLAGRSLEILYSKRRGGGRVFVCDAGDGGSLTVPIEWTDRGPAADEVRLSPESLTELLVLVNVLLRGCADRGEGA
jgi:hypothetical protein